VSFLHPAALALLALALLIVILSILRARQRRREVAALGLWDGLMESAPTRMTTLRYFIDLELLLQLACLLFLATALAEPLWHGQRESSGAIAVVLDSSASMRALTPEGVSRYAAAREQALAVLGASPAAPAAIAQLSESPRVLAAPSAGRRAVAQAVAGSSPSYLANGDAADLASLLDAVGGAASYERVLVFTDHPLVDVPFPVSYVILPQADNVAITAFSVREQPSGHGVAAFVEVSNASRRAVSTRVTVQDESARTALDVFLEAGESAQFVVPFPLSRGSQFTASVEGNDALPLDNVRYASLARALELRVRWLGAENRFLAAALEAALPTTRVGSDEAPDLTVAYDTELQSMPEGNALLVHTSVHEVVESRETGTGGFARRLVTDDPLLAGIEAEDVFVERIDALEIPVSHEVLLSAGSSPLVVRLGIAGGSVLVLNTDLYGTNLPITVDFPLLVRNFLASVVRLPGRPVIRWNMVGRPVNLAAFGPVSSMTTPVGEVVTVPEGQQLFAPDQPGPYELLADGHRFPLSVNIDPSESAEGETATQDAAATIDALFRKDVVAVLWPYAAALALALLIAEAMVAYDALRSWRTRRAA
jgi:hypothetical protein